jgi:hypothetical protein
MLTLLMECLEIIFLTFFSSLFAWANARGNCGDIVGTKWVLGAEHDQLGPAQVQILVPTPQHLMGKKMDTTTTTLTQEIDQR